MPSMRNGTKLTSIVIKWALGVVTLIAVALASMGYDTLQASIQDLKTDIGELKTKLDNMDNKMDGIVLNDGLQGKDITRNWETIEEHKEVGHR